MTDGLSGDIVIDNQTVRFSDNVGHYVTNEQVAVLYRTAEWLGKIAVQDRYPTDPVFADCTEMLYGWHRPCRRNEHGVPEESVWDSMIIQARELGIIE